MVCCLVGVYNTSSIYNFGSAYEVSCTYLEIKILQPAFVARWSPEAKGVFHGKISVRSSDHGGGTSLRVKVTKACKTKRKIMRVYNIYILLLYSYTLKTGVD